MRALLDTNVLIDVTRTRRAVVAFLQATGITEAYICTGTYVELLGGEKLRRKADARKLLREFMLLEFTAATNKLAYQLAMQHEFSGSRTLDTLIAATALYHHMPLVTANIRDFQKIDGLQLIPYLSDWTA